MAHGYLFVLINLSVADNIWLIYIDDN